MREREKQYQSIQNELEKYLDMLSQVDRHLKTLIKFLKNVVDKSNDPQIIEHTQRQIKGIDNVHKDIKKAIYHNDHCASESSKLMEGVFSLDGETAKFGSSGNASYDHHNSRSGNPSGRPSIGARSHKSMQKKPESEIPEIKDQNEFKHPKDIDLSSSSQKLKKSDKNDLKVKKQTNLVLNEVKNPSNNLVNTSQVSEMTIDTKCTKAGAEIELLKSHGKGANKGSKRTQKVK